MTNPSEAGVLAVIDDVLSTPTGMLSEEIASLRQARATIAEYIAANEECDAAELHYLKCSDAFDWSCARDAHKSQERAEAQAAKRAAALRLNTANKRHAAAHAAMLGVVS